MKFVSTYAMKPNREVDGVQVLRVPVALVVYESTSLARRRNRRTSIKAINCLPIHT